MLKKKRTYFISAVKKLSPLRKRVLYLCKNVDNFFKIVICSRSKLFKHGDWFSAIESIELVTTSQCSLAQPSLRSTKKGF